MKTILIAVAFLIMSFAGYSEVVSKSGMNVSDFQSNLMSSIHSEIKGDNISYFEEMYFEPNFFMAYWNDHDNPNIKNKETYKGNEFEREEQYIIHKKCYSDIRTKKYILVPICQVVSPTKERVIYNFELKAFIFTDITTRMNYSGDASTDKGYYYEQFVSFSKPLKLELPIIIASEHKDDYEKGFGYVLFKIEGTHIDKQKNKILDITPLRYFITFDNKTVYKNY